VYRLDEMSTAILVPWFKFTIWSGFPSYLHLLLLCSCHGVVLESMRCLI